MSLNTRSTCVFLVIPGVGGYALAYPTTLAQLSTRRPFRALLSLGRLRHILRPLLVSSTTVLSVFTSSFLHYCTVAVNGTISFLSPAATAPGKRSTHASTVHMLSLNPLSRYACNGRLLHSDIFS